MKTSSLKIGVLLLAVVPGGTALSTEPFDRMPTPGNRLPELEQRIRRLEERLSALEAGAKKSDAKAGDNPMPSAPVRAALEWADHLSTGDDLPGAAKAYEEALDDCLSHLEATPQSLTDTFTTCYSLAIAGENMLAKGQRDLAKKLWEASLKGLRRCQETLPGWLPAIVEYRRKKVEEQLARLK